MLQVGTNIRLIFGDTSIYNEVLDKQSAIDATEAAILLKVFLKELIRPTELDETTAASARDTLIERFNKIKMLCQFVLDRIQSESWEEAKFISMMTAFTKMNDSEDVNSLDNAMSELAEWAKQLYKDI